MAQIETSDAILARLLSLHPKIIDLSLERLTRLLARLGNPERALPPVIHVAGTNGKGSTCAYVRAGLEKAPFPSKNAPRRPVHAYSSPHLARFHERIRLAGDLIDEQVLSETLEACEAANHGDPITFFEITTAAAFLAFSRVPADYTILEVGLGGRLDATNVIDAPALTIITPVSLDHQQYLGETLTEIATEKAGILKPGVPCVVGPQDPEAMDAIRARAAAVGAPLIVHGEDFHAQRENDRMAFQHVDGLLDLPRPALPGDWQIDNAALALAGLRALGRGDLETATAAVSQAAWPARMQRLRFGPLVDALPNGAELWLDGGHNPAAGAALGGLLREMNAARPAPLFLICGMLNTKDAAGYMRGFADVASRLYAVEITGESATLSAAETAAAARRAGLKAAEANSVGDALAACAAESKTAPPRILICGSLYLAGRVLRANG